MQQPDTLIEKLKQAIISTLDRTIDSPTDFDYLSIKISEKTGDTISSSTLKRLFGYIKPATTPRPSTLSSLARYVGYSGWSEFCAAQSLPEKLKSTAQTTKSYIKIAAVAVALAFIGWGVWYFTDKPPAAQKQTKVDSVEQQAPKIEQQAPKLSNADKYERIRANCINASNQMCRTILAQSKGMDRSEYLRFVDSCYNKFVFTDLKHIIAKQVGEAFADDAALQQRYGNDVFIQCREICINMLREAYKGADQT